MASFSYEEVVHNSQLCLEFRCRRRVRLAKFVIFVSLLNVISSYLLQQILQSSSSPFGLSEVLDHEQGASVEQSLTKQERSVLIVLLLIAAVITIVLIRMAWGRVALERILCIKGVGIQHEKQFAFFRTERRFYPAAKVVDMVINEAWLNYRFVYYLVLLVNEDGSRRVDTDTKLVVLFEVSNGISLIESVDCWFKFVTFSA